MSVVDLEAMKAHLNISRVSAADAVIQSTIDEVEAAIAQRCGPLEPKTMTDRITVGRSQYSLVLPITPVVDLTSVTPYAGTALGLDLLYLDSDAGIITRNDNGCFTMPYCDVVYRAGRETCPDDLVRAVKETVQYFFEGSALRGGVDKPGGSSGDATSNTVPGAVIYFPFRVEQMMAPHLQLAIG